MKNSKFNLFAPSSSINRATCLLTIAITAAMPSAQAVVTDIFWNNTGTTANSAASWWTTAGGPTAITATQNSVSAGDIWNFSSAAAGFNTIGFTANRSVVGIVFSSTSNAYSVGDATFGLTFGSTGIINNSTTAIQTFTGPVFLGASSLVQTAAGGTLQFNGNFDLGTAGSMANRTLTIQGAGTTNIVGVLSNGTGGALAQAVAVTSTGTTALSGNNTYDGTTTMNALGGVLSLSGDNSGASGGVTLTAGTLNVKNANALGTGPVSLASSSVLDNTSGAAIANLGNNPVTWGTNSATAVTFGTVASTALNNIDLGAGTVTAGSSRLLTLAGTGTTLTMGPVNITSTSASGRTLTATGAGNTLNMRGLTLSAGTAPVTVVLDGTANLIISGPIVNGSAFAHGIEIASTGTTTLSGVNTFTGNVALTAGTLNINNNNALGAGTSLSCAASTTINNTSGVAVINAGNQTWSWPSNNATVTVPQTVPLTNPLTFGTTLSTAANNLDLGTGVVTASSSRSIILAGTGTTLTMGPVNITSTSASGRTLTATGAGNTLNMRGLTLSAGTAPVTVVLDGTANLIISGPIVNGSAFANGVEIDRTGSTAVFSGTNTYSGLTKISSGTLQINGPAALASASTLNSGGSASDTSTLNLATASANYAMDSLSIGGIMRFTGPASGSATLTFAGSGAQGFTGAAAEKKINVASAVNVVVNGSPFNLLGAATTANRDHTLQVDGSMTFNSVIESTGAAFTAGFSKTGTGVLTLGAANTYNGTTFAEAGILRLGNATAIPGGIAATGGTSALVLSGGAIIGLTPASGDFTRNISAAAFDYDDLTLLSPVLPVTNVGWVPGATGGFAAFGGDRSVNFGGAGASVGWSSSNGRFGGGLILGHSTSDSTITVVNPISIGDTNARTIIVNDGTKTVDAILSGAVTGGAGSSLVKDGAGTLALNAANTYTGETNVIAGVLAVNGTSIVDANKLIIDGGKVQLTGTETVGSLFFGAVQQAFGTWGATDSGATNIDNVRFSGTGVLSVVEVVLDPYASWINGAAYNTPPLSTADKLPTADPDGDSINNLMEFVLGGNPVVSSQSILPTQATVGSNLVLSYKRSDASEFPATTQTGQWSTDLSTWTTVTPVLVAENGAAADDMTISVPTSNAVAGRLFVRLKVVK